MIFPVTSNIRGTVAALESQIRDAVFKSQDTIESFVSTWVLWPESEPIPGDLQGIIATFYPITAKAEEIAKSMERSLWGTEGTGPLTEESISSKFTSRSKTTRVFGQEKDFKKVMDELTGWSDDLEVLAIVGMPGIGKTTLASCIYHDRRVDDVFLARAWATVSPEGKFHDIFAKLLSSIETKGQKGSDPVSTERIGVSRESAEQLALRLHQTLYGTRYLLVIDDMWATYVWYRLKQYFPDNKNGSRIILTTRDKGIASYVNPRFRHEMEPLDEENSWRLFCDTVFGDWNCPPHLEATGRNIASKCGGLPLLLAVIGGHLSQERKIVEYWDIIEQDIYKVAAADNSEESYIERLTLSYNYLPSRLKGCFLYMGGFPENSEILVSKLIQLWVAEGFLNDSKALEGEIIYELLAKKFLEELVDRNLIMICEVGSDGQIKSCGIHNVLRDIAVKECEKEKFFHGIKSYRKPITEGTETQRRLSVHNNIFMCMEEVRDSAKGVTTARSFLFTGNYHPHPYPFSLDFECLRVLDALTVYFVEFPNEVLYMIHLSYLSLTYNGNLPSSIAKLRNLQVLIVRQHPKIICLSMSILPAEIWNMSQLRHLFLTETELPDLSGVEFLAKDSFLLENLQSLSSVNAASCTLENLRRFPYLKKLDMWVAKPGSVEFHIDKLEALEVFKFTVLNPNPGSKIEFLPELAFPKRLRKLSLSGCAIPWDDMTIIGQLEHLQVLKLRGLSFHGSNVTELLDDEGEGETKEEVSAWEPEQGQFRVLKYLLLESLDLNIWDADDTHFPSLETLIIRHCYDLEFIPLEIGDIERLELIEVIECNPSCVASAREIKKKQERIKKRLQVRIYSSWE